MKSHFTDVKTEAQRGEGSCPGPHSSNDLKAFIDQ